MTVDVESLLKHETLFSSFSHANLRSAVYRRGGSQLQNAPLRMTNECNVNTNRVLCDFISKAALALADPPAPSSLNNVDSDQINIVEDF